MKVAVYGSLLKGLGNHRLLEDSLLLGEDTTSPNYTMYDLGSFPGLLNEGNNTYTVEVYDVDDHTLQRLDWLEGYNAEQPERSFYMREVIQTQYGEAYIYFLNEDRVNMMNKVVTDSSWRNYRTKKNEELCVD
jgi:gamma-glutamylcyclotransferase (GGCT)/AIG2-like uncharacterized protein YtfP